MMLRLLVALVAAVFAALAMLYLLVFGGLTAPVETLDAGTRAAWFVTAVLVGVVVFFIALRAPRY